MSRLNRFRQRLLGRENRSWDERVGVDTRGWFVPDAQAVVSKEADGFPYAGTHWRLARAMLRSLRPNAAGATFVDLEFGKGRVLLVAAGLPFEQVVGVEYAHVLHRVAERNIATVAGQGEADRRPRVRSELVDVREFEFPSSPLVIYLNNPFPEPVLSNVLATLTRSYDAAPRPITILYQQLRVEDDEHRTRNVALIGELPFVAPRRLSIRGALNRVLLGEYALNAFSSPEVVS